VWVGQIGAVLKRHLGQLAHGPASTMQANVDFSRSALSMLARTPRNSDAD
jgi:hypothetical protein